MKLTRLLVIFVVVLGLFAPMAMSARPVAAQAPVVYNYLPTAYLTDGKMMVIASGADYKTLSLEPIRMLILTDAPQLEFGVFDADIGGRWDSYGSGPRGRIAYRVYGDPDASGDPTGKTLLGEWFSDDVGAVDNAWYSITMAHRPEAFDGSQFSYLFTISQEDATAVSIADFKIRAVGTLAVAEGVTFGFEGAVTGALDIVFPNWPSTSVTTYDGLWSFGFFVPDRAPLDEVSLWDGDLDYGDGGVTVSDTDDPDTPAIIPGFSDSPHAVPEGAQGVGSPPENNPFTPVARGNPVTYELVSPDGAHYLNTNPSGNQEWEHFLIRTTTHSLGCSAGGNADYCVASLSPGVWTVNMFGMDASNVNYFHFDYGVLPGSSSAGLNGYVYEDLDRDGVFDANEVGLVGVLVTLSGVDLAGNAVNLSTHTVAGGYYEFVPLPAGTYTVVETDPAGYFSVSVSPGSTGGTRSADFNTLSGIPLAANQLSANNNFGDLHLGSIGDFVWHDLHHSQTHLVDGIQDAGEPGIGGVVVELYKGGSNIAQTVTTSTGFYQFTGLEAGDYVVKVADSNFAAGGVLEGWFASPKDTGGNNAVDSDGDVVTHNASVSLGHGEANPTIDFGFFDVCLEFQKTGPAGPVKPGDTITYHFRVKNCGDIVLHGGVQVFDAKLNPSGDHQIWTAVVWPGQDLTFDKTYTVKTTDCGQLVNTATAVGHPLHPDGHYLADIVQQASWSVAVECQPSLGAIGDFVWHDKHYSQTHLVDGIQDTGEPGIGGVLVELYQGSNKIAEKVTTAVGFYQFTGLAAGNYVVKVANSNFATGGVLEGWYASPKDTGSNNAVDSDGDEVTHQASVSLGSGEVNPTIDFGFFDVCLEFQKTGPAGAVKPGDTITYRFRVKNCGDIVLSGGVSIFDAKLNPSGDHLIWNAVVWPGQEYNIDKTYTVKTTDCGQLVNTATAVGHPLHPDGHYLQDITQTGTWTVQVDCTSPPPPPEKIYVSTACGGSVNGVYFADEDILAYNTAANTWSMYFDGSDVGLSGTNVDAFDVLSDGRILLSFSTATYVTGLGTVDDSDIVRFVPTSTGPQTKGSFQWFFDGSDVGLSTDGEDIDAIDLTADGKLIISTVGDVIVSGLTREDEDLLKFTATSWGQQTQGSWALYFDGSDVGLGASSEDVNGVWIDGANGEIYLTTEGSFAVPGGISGDGADIFVFTPQSLGANTTGSFRFYWDGSAHGMSGKVVDGIDIVR